MMVDAVHANLIPSACPDPELATPGRMDPYWDRLWAPGSQAAWSNRSLLEARAARRERSVNRRFLMEEAEALRLLDVNRGRRDRLGLWGALDSYRTVTAEQAAAFAGAPLLLDPASSAVAASVAVGLMDVGTFPSPGALGAPLPRCDLPALDHGRVREAHRSDPDLAGVGRRDRRLSVVRRVPVRPAQHPRRRARPPRRRIPPRGRCRARGEALHHGPLRRLRAREGVAGDGQPARRRHPGPQRRAPHRDRGHRHRLRRAGEEGAPLGGAAARAPPGDLRTRGGVRRRPAPGPAQGHGLGPGARALPPHREGTLRVPQNGRGLPGRAHRRRVLGRVVPGEARALRGLLHPGGRLRPRRRGRA